MVCLAHRAIHRYVVRAKQGGRQSVKDQAKPGIKSMGSQLRRHNEEALARDITNVLLSWQAHVARAHRILLQVVTATGDAIEPPAFATNLLIRPSPCACCAMPV